MAKKLKRVLHQCSRCRKRKSRKDFGPSKSSKSGLHYWCYECCRASQRELYANLSPEAKEARLAKQRNRPAPPQEVIWDKTLRRNYRMTLEEFDQRVVAQGGKCAACERSFTSRPQVDHDHTCCDFNVKTCGKCVRDLLCPSCNTALGRVNDSIERLYALINYLKKWN